MHNIIYNRNKEDNKWRCNHCNYINNDCLTYCKACGKGINGQDNPLFLTKFEYRVEDYNKVNEQLGEYHPLTSVIGRNKNEIYWNKYIEAIEDGRKKDSSLDII